MGATTMTAPREGRTLGRSVPDMARTRIWLEHAAGEDNAPIAMGGDRPHVVEGQFATGNGELRAAGRRISGQGAQLLGGVFGAIDREAAAIGNHGPELIECHRQSPRTLIVSTGFGRDKPELRGRHKKPRFAAKARERRQSTAPGLPIAFSSRPRVISS